MGWLLSIADFVRDKRGATAIEYGLIAGLISVVIVVALIAVREEILVLPMGRIANAFN